LRLLSTLLCGWLSTLLFPGLGPLLFGLGLLLGLASLLLLLLSLVLLFALSIGLCISGSSSHEKQKQAATPTTRMTFMNVASMIPELR
jgi:hypothetical protein